MHTFIVFHHLKSYNLRYDGWSVHVCISGTLTGFTSSVWYFYPWISDSSLGD